MNPVRRARVEGFTLVEVVIAIGVLSVVLVAGTSVVTEAVEVSRGFGGSSAALADARTAVDRLGRQWRAIEVQRLSGGSEYAVTTATSISVVFSRRNDNGTLTPVTIAYASRAVTMKEGNNTPQTLISGVSTFSLGYFPEVGGATALGNCSGSCPSSWRRDIRAVRIEMTVSSASGGSSTFTNWIAVRSS